MLAGFGETVGDEFELPQRAVGHARRTVQLVHRHQVDRIACDLDAVHPLFLRDDLTLVRDPVAIGVAEHHHIALRPARQIDRSVFGDPHHAGILKVLGKDVHREARGQRQAVHALLRPIERYRFQDVTDDFDALSPTILLGRRFAAARTGLGEGRGGREQGKKREGDAHGKLSGDWGCYLARTTPRLALFR